jgi:hypothetical protein
MYAPRGRRAYELSRQQTIIENSQIGDSTLDIQTGNFFHSRTCHILYRIVILTYAFILVSELIGMLWESIVRAPKAVLPVEHLAQLLSAVCELLGAYFRQLMFNYFSS